MEELLPNNFIDLCYFINLWAEKYADQYPNIELIENVINYRAFLMERALTQYLDYCSAIDQIPDFGSDLFRAMITAAQGVTNELDKEPYVDENRDALLMANYNILELELKNHGYCPLNMAPGPEVDFVQPVTITTAFIHPQSENQEEAARLLAFILDEMEPEKRLIVFKDEKEPIIHSEYEGYKAELEEEIDQIKIEITTAQQKDKALLEENLEALHQKEEYNNKVKFLIDQKTINWFHNRLTPLLFGNGKTFLPGNDPATEEVFLLLQAYINGQVDLETFIAKANSKINMIMGEQ